MRNKFIRKLFIFCVPCLMLGMNSCRILNSNIMLEAEKNFAYDALQFDSAAFSAEYRLAPDDVVEFRLFANDGFKMVDLISGAASAGNPIARQAFEYTLDNTGSVKLPILGMVLLDSMTLREAETFLEARYAQYYVKPFVLLKVVNRRVIVFPGDPGTARVLSLPNSNTTVFEAIAFAGGISANGKAHKVTLIRQTDDPHHPKVYKLDLSKIENVYQGNIVVQSNDIIYVEPRKKFASRTLQEITPIMSLISAGLTLYLLFTRF